MSVNKNINTDWKFKLEDTADAYYMGFDDSAWQTVQLPHDWSVSYPFSKENSSGTGYLPGGTAWYRKTLNFQADEIEGKSVYITFGGVYKNSRVWCNSNYLGKRPYGYSSFTYDLTEFVKAGKNVISVKVEHNDLADSRWFTGSGIYRDVTLSIAEKIHFDKFGDGIFAYSENVSRQSAELFVEWKLCGGEAEVEFILKDKNNNIAASASDSGHCGKTRLLVEKPQFWDVENPYLYTLVCNVKAGGMVYDSDELLLGVRSIRFDCNEGFFLNGKNMKFKGVCLHHDAGALGAAVPKSVWRRRLTKLKEVGCNAVRTSHNPHDPVLLDLCDEMGFLVMDECFDEWEGCKNKWWQGHNVYPPKRFGYADDFPAWHEIDLTDFVKRDRNHPSVVLWSIGNEMDYPNDPYCHPDFDLVTGNNDANKPEQERVYDENKPNAKRLASIARELTAIVKQSDRSRPVTAALAFPELADIIGYTDAVDVAGYNYKEKLYHDDHEKHPSRIILGSENGHEPFDWAQVRDNDYISGQFLWTGIDYMGEARGWPVRASGAGILDMAGFPKPRFYQRQALWSEKPCAALVTNPMNNKSAKSLSWNYTDGEMIEVNAYTNCKNAELFLCGNSFGVKVLTDDDLCTTSWLVPFTAGELKLVCMDKDGAEVSASITTAGEPAAIQLNPDRETVRAGSRDFIQLEAVLLDSKGIPVINNDRELSFKVSGDAQLMGIENGDIADLTPYTSESRKTCGGRLIAYFRAGNEPQDIIIICESPDGLQSKIIISCKDN